MTAVEIGELVLKILQVAGPPAVALVMRWIDGDRSDEARRVLDELPEELRATVALVAERAETERQLREALG